MNTPIKHCNATVMHTKSWNGMRSRQAPISGRGTGNDVSVKAAQAKRKAPFAIKEEAYERSNKKMRSEYTSETGKKLGNKTENGKTMFIYQASAAFKIWHVSNQLSMKRL